MYDDVLCSDYVSKPYKERERLYLMKYSKKSSTLASILMILFHLYQQDVILCQFRCCIA